jgi:LuxR family quorum-sensing system transcriptional regulator SolR
MDSKLFHWQVAQTEALLTAESEMDFQRVLTAAANELGFEHFSYGMRMPLPLSNPRTFMFNNYPLAWQQRYAQENYIAIDPTVAHGLKSVMPLVWSDAVFQSAPAFWNEARDHGLQVGWAQSSYDAKHVVSMLSFARSREELSASELQKNSMRMSWLAQTAHEGMSRLVAAQTPAAQPVTLTPREAEILRWTADGKTSGEVGDILAISERTVNFHVNNALLKLGAVNKTAGVIKAVLLGLV